MTAQTLGTPVRKFKDTLSAVTVVMREFDLNGRKLREDLTKEEKERLEKYGMVKFKSAGATRKR